MKVLIAEDRLGTRRGLKALLGTVPEVEVVGEAENGRMAVRLANDTQPEVVLMDARMPIMDGIEATREIKARWPWIRVVMLTMYAAQEADAEAAGADAFLVKGCSPKVLLAAIMDRSEEAGAESRG